MKSSTKMMSKRGFRKKRWKEKDWTVHDNKPGNARRDPPKNLTKLTPLPNLTTTRRMILLTTLNILIILKKRKSMRTWTWRMAPVGLRDLDLPTLMRNLLRLKKSR